MSQPTIPDLEISNAPGTTPSLTIVIREPRATSSQTRHRSRPGHLELTPDPTWAWDGDEWLSYLGNALQAADIIDVQAPLGPVVMVAEAAAIPLAVSASTRRPGVDVVLLLPRSVGRDLPPENALPVVESGCEEPLILLGYERTQSSANGPRNDAWLKLFGRSRLARHSHFDYLPARPSGVPPLREPRIVEHLVAKALVMKRSLRALREIKEADGTKVPDETLDRAQTTYQGMVVLAMHRLRKAGGSPDWILDKLESKEWAASRGFPVARLRHVLHDPSELTLAHFDPAAVVKPVMGSSSQGVKILRREGDSLLPPGSSQALDLAELQGLQSDALRGLRPDAAARGLMIEDPVLDAGGQPTRVDYKFFFSGRSPVLAMMVERRSGGIFCHWTSADGRITHPNPVWTNTFYRHVAEMPRPEEWQQLLDTATAIYRATGFDFTRIDMYLGADGPVLGEVTPSPGNFFYGNGDKLALAASLAIAREVHTASLPEELS